MFAYNPTVNDQSGQITAGYQTKSAEIKAAGNEALAQGIAEGITSIVGGVAGAYAKGKAQTAEGKAFKEFMGVAGKNLGFTAEDLDFFKNIPDQDAYQMSNVAAPMLPSMFNAAIYQQRAGNQLALQNQTAANQAALRQPAANQVPLGAQAPAATANPETLPAPAFIDPSVKTRSLLKR
jgi:hypothetical protein